MIRLLTIVVILTILCPISLSYGNDLTLEKAWGYYLKADYNKSLEACRIISKKKMLKDQGYYLMGLSFLKLGDIEEARKNLLFALKNYPNSKLKTELLLSIADSYYLVSDYLKAEGYYKKALKTSKGIDYSSIAYLRLGLSLRKQGRFKEADSFFSKTVRDYPFSLEAKDAKNYLKKKIEFFSVQVGVFSKRENAKGLADKLRSKGYDAYIEKTYEKDSLVYRVKAGTFSQRHRAEVLADKLKKQGFPVRIYP